MPCHKPMMGCCWAVCPGMGGNGPFLHSILAHAHALRAPSGSSRCPPVHQCFSTCAWPPHPTPPAFLLPHDCAPALPRGFGQRSAPAFRSAQTCAPGLRTCRGHSACCRRSGPWGPWRIRRRWQATAGSGAAASPEQVGTAFCVAPCVPPNPGLPPQPPWHLVANCLHACVQHAPRERQQHAWHHPTLLPVPASAD